MTYATLFPLNLMIVLGSVVIAGLSTSLLTGIGVFGPEYVANPLDVFSALVTYGLPYLAVLATGGIVFLAALALTGSARRGSALLMAPVAALPALAFAFVGPGTTAANVATPILFAVTLAAAVRLPPVRAPH